MPLISEPVLALITSIITLCTGIFWEKFYVGRDAMIINSICLLVTLAATDFALSGWYFLGIVLVISYIILGWSLLKTKGHSKLKQLFGSKAYGSLALAVAIVGMGWAGPFTWFLTSVGISSDSFLVQNIVLFVWMVVVVLTIVSFVIVKKEKLGF
jgi:hypothetical protein